MGLTLWWRLDGNGNDSSGNGNTGTITNATSSANGKIGSAYFFNNNNASVVTGSNLDLSGDISFSAWIYPTDLTTQTEDSATIRGIVSNLNHPSYSGFSMYIWNSVLRVHVGYTDNTRADAFVGTTTFSTNRWYHVAMSYSDTTKRITTYIDGVVESSTVLTKQPKFLAQRIIAGQWAYSFLNNYEFFGNIDEVRVYDHSLSTMEVQELAKAKILHYQFNDPREEPTTNLIGNGHFDGGNHADEFSAAASYGTYDISQLLNPGGSDYVLRQRSGEYEVIITGLSSSTTYTLSCWVAYSSDWNGVNTQILHSRAFSSSGAHTTTSGAGTLLETRVVSSLTWERREVSITTPSDSTGTLSWYVGYLADATVGYRYLTNLQFEKKDHSTPFVDGTRTGIALDSSGFGNDSNTITEVLTPEWDISSKMGSYSALFNGTNTLIDTNIAQTALGQEFTISAWVYPTAASNYRGVIGDHLNYTGLIFSQYQTNAFYFGYGNGTAWIEVGSASLTLNSWNHITMVLKTGTGGFGKVFLNGVQQGSGISNPSAFSPHSSIKVGRAYNASDRYFQGNIDNIKIYTTALSDAEALSLYERRAAIDNSGNIHADTINEVFTGNARFDNKGVANFVDYSNVGVVNANLAGYWQLDDDTDDYSGNEFNATNSGATSSGSYYSFNGSSHLYVTDPSSLNLPSSNDQFTIFARIRVDNISSKRGIFSYGTFGTANQASALAINSDGRLQHYFWANDLFVSTSTFNFANNLNTWLTVAVTFNGTTRRIYINGELAASDTPSSVNVVIDDILIGKTYSTEYFDGDIDYVKLFSIALSAEEIAIEHKFSNDDSVKSQLSNNDILYFNGEPFEGL